MEAAVRVADAEGLDAVSMRRIATELGTGTMSLYRYVPGKAELLDLMLDRVQRPSENPADLGDGSWRAALEATGPRDPRPLPPPPLAAPGQPDPPDPRPERARRHGEDALPHPPMGLTDPELVSAIIMIDGYVVGAARTQVYQQEAERTYGH